MDMIKSPADIAAETWAMVKDQPFADPEDREATLKDALANILHCAEANGLNPLAVLESAAGHWASERALTVAQREDGDIGVDWRVLGEVTLVDPDGLTVDRFELDIDLSRRIAQ